MLQELKVQREVAHRYKGFKLNDWTHFIEIFLQLVVL
jgi:hypothetical protein